MIAGVLQIWPRGCGFDSYDPHLFILTSPHSGKGAVFVDVNILVAVPCFGGLIQSRTMCSLIELDRLFYANKIEHTISTVTNETLVTKARNRYANIAAFDEDSEHRKFTHVLFVDADMVFSAQDVVTMIHANKPIIGLPYCRKNFVWESVAKAVRAGVPDDQLKYFVGDVCFNSSKPVPVNEITPVDQLGTGVMLIASPVFIALAERYPERKYTLYEMELESEFNRGRTFAHEFFRAGIDPKSNMYLSEDYCFTEDARLSGFASYVLPSAKTGHLGSFEYLTHLSVLAASGLVGPRNMRFCETPEQFEAQQRNAQNIEHWKQTRCPKGLLNERHCLDLNNSEKISQYIAEHCEGQFTAENLDKAVEALRLALSWYLTPEPVSPN
jgi:hypothetical protein